MQTIYFSLKKGELVVHGRPKDILSAAMIEKVFNIKTTVIREPGYWKTADYL
jgi:ABC-type cobalamin/Fe3+-siderophores transport system ATPase subunit